MSRSHANATTAALSRAQKSYAFAIVLMGAFWIMSRRAGFQPDRVIPYERRNLIRIAEGVVIVVGMVILSVVIRRLMRRRADALGEASATVDLVAEDFVKAKTLVALVLAIPAFMGLMMTMAGHEPMVINVLLFVFPLFLMLVSWPTKAGMSSFADQVNALREPQTSDGETEAT